MMDLRQTLSSSTSEQIKNTKKLQSYLIDNEKRPLLSIDFEVDTLYI